MVTIRQIKQHHIFMSFYLIHLNILRISKPHCDPAETAFTVSSHSASVSRSSQSLCFARAGGNRALLTHVRELGLQLSKTHNIVVKILQRCPW